MALTITIEGLGELDNAEAVTNWGIAGSGGSAFALDSEIYYQGSGSMNSKISSGKQAWLYYNHGSPLNFTTTYSGECVLIWWQVTTPGSASAINGAQQGFSVRMGSSTTVYREWRLGGSDAAANGYTGGWQCAVIDPNSTGSNDVGSYSAASVQYIGIHYDGNTASRAENLFVDAIMVGSGIRITGTETTSGAGWQEVVDYCTDRANRAWGFIQEKEPGIFTVYGTLYVGDSTQTATTTLTDSGRIFKWGDYRYFSNLATPTESSAIGNSFHGIVVEDAASFATTFTDGIIVGSDAGRSGSSFIGVDDANTTFDLYGGSSTSSITKLYGSTLTQIDGGITWGDDGDHHCYSVTMSGCGQFDPVGGVVIRNSTFAETISTTGAVLWNSNMDIASCNFLANTTGEAIEHDTIISVYTTGTVTTGGSSTALPATGSTFVGNVAVNDYAYNETDGSYAKVTTVTDNTNLVTEALADDPLVGGTGSLDWANGDVYSISPAITYTDLVFSGNTSDVTNSATGSDALFITKAGTTDPTTATGTVVYIGAVTLQVTVVDTSNNPIENAQTAIFLSSDDSELLNGDTNASGIISGSYTGSTPADVYIRVRKSSTGTRYLNFSTTGTITATGLTTTVVLTEDTIVT